VKSSIQKAKESDIQNCYNFDAIPNDELFDALNTLMDSYQLSAPQKTRLYGFFNAAINDATVITWFYKFLYEIPRPNQLDPRLETLVCTPYHPSYPSGHSVLGSTVIELLSNLFPDETDSLNRIFSDLKKARLNSGVHYNADNDNGEILGRKIGKNIFRKMSSQKDADGKVIDVYKMAVKKPVLKVKKRKNMAIFSCNSLIHKKSISYMDKNMN